MGSIKPSKLVPKIPLLETYVLDYCWICEAKSIPFDEHHIVPRAFGGEHGPQITLCGSHHTLVHNLGLALLKQLTSRAESAIIDNADSSDLQSLSIQGQKRTRYLATIIAKAGASVTSDVNKTIKYAGQFSAEQNRKLVAIKQALGVSSKHDAIVRCMDQMYKTLFK